MLIEQGGCFIAGGTGCLMKRVSHYVGLFPYECKGLLWLGYTWDSLVGLIALNKLKKHNIYVSLFISLDHVCDKES
ncbi:hypothetical protein XELAEV_18030781mg [Xenopus laevis]|uniref:Uncharacterized protein n=1 Tax=Xenopus laevis TaxID=8355 RepID=A0A974CM41_XENLA|nr:hypothetical protein XELAEV_18030781mg [Xenopus laevis]